MVYVWLLLIVLLISTNLMATDYVVSGAGSSSVNGTYTESGTYSGYPQYRLGSTGFYIRFYSGHWTIFNYDWYETYYYTDIPGSTPPSTGWEVYAGSSPAPSVIGPPTLTYSTDAFTESSAEDGTISNSITIIYGSPGDDYFTGSNGTFSTSNYSTTNVSSGLTVVITRNSNTELSVSLTGTASNHTNVSNMEIAFNNSAFNDGNAAAVSNSTKSDIKINFIQDYTVAASGGDFTTIAAALAASNNGDRVQISAGTYTENNLSITKNITITGQGAGSTIVQGASSQGDGSGNYRVFLNYAISTLENITVRFGDYSGWSGAGIFNSGTLTVNNCTIANNNCVGHGAGIYNATQGSSSNINNSTICNNVSSGSGTGTAIFSGLVTTCNLTNSTIFNNVVTGGAYPAALYIYGNTSVFTIVNSTVYGNDGGLVSEAGGTFEVKNSLLAGNDDYDYHIRNTGTLTDNGYNIVKIQTNAGSQSDWKFNHATDILYNYKADGTSGWEWTQNSVTMVNQNLNISASLADNNTTKGTQTLALSSGSFAIDAGTSIGAPTTDQRGANRNGTVDIGAYEFWDDNGSLPVELTDFGVECRSKGVMVKWVTESEIENLGFIIQRKSTVGAPSEWIEISSYIDNKSLEGHGSTTAKNEYQYTDKSVQPGATYKYRLGDVDYIGKVTWHKTVEITVKTGDAQIATTFGLQKAYPNPFNPITTIAYELPQTSNVTVKIFDVGGRLVETLINQHQNAGNYRVQWNASGYNSGVYFYRIEAGNFQQVRKMLLIK